MSAIKGFETQESVADVKPKMCDNTHYPTHYYQLLTSECYSTIVILALLTMALSTTTPLCMSLGPVLGEIIIDTSISSVNETFDRVEGHLRRFFFRRCVYIHCLPRSSLTIHVITGLPYQCQPLAFICETRFELQHLIISIKVSQISLPIDNAIGELKIIGLISLKAIK